MPSNLFFFAEGGVGRGMLLKLLRAAATGGFPLDVVGVDALLVGVLLVGVVTLLGNGGD
jgi:hypothetical protein